MIEAARTARHHIIRQNVGSAGANVTLCPVCLAVTAVRPSAGRSAIFACSTCGIYKISDLALQMLQVRYDDLDWTIVSALISELVEQAAPAIPLIDVAAAENLVADSGR